VADSAKTTAEICFGNSRLTHTGQRENVSVGEKLRISGTGKNDWSNLKSQLC